MRKKRIWKHITVIALAMAAATAAIGGISAYFTDTQEKTNTLTVGSVKTDLEEPEWEDVPTDEKTDITPNQTIKKDPRITNTGSNDAYAFMEIQVPVKKIITVGTDGKKLPAADTELFTYQINDGWVKVQSSDITTSGNVTARSYIYAYGTETECTVLKKGETTPPLFDSVTLVNAIEGQIDEETLNIPVKSYAIQAEYIGESKVPSDVFQIYMKQNQ